MKITCSISLRETEHSGTIPKEAFYLYKRPPRALHDNVASLVSVVIPTRNSANTLPVCLGSIRNQTYTNIEIIIIDGNSTDNTVEVAQQFHCEVLVADYERTKAKNFALAKCRGKYVCFIDSDMELTSNVLTDCVNLAESSHDVGGIVIPERSVGEGYWIKVRDFERSLYYNTEVESARFFERDLALKVGGFDEDIIFYEESTLPKKLEKAGYNTRLRVNSVILHHETSFKFRTWMKKKYYYGKSIKQFTGRYQNQGTPQASLNYRVIIFVKNGGWRLLKNIHLTIGVIILKCGELTAVLLART